MFSFIAAQLIGLSLTVSPIGGTYHLVHVDDPTPRSILGQNGLTWHPELAVKIATKHWETHALILSDTYGRLAGAAFTGPKLDLIQDRLSFGAGFGVYVRQPYRGDKPPTIYTSSVAEVIPMIGATGSYTQPISKHFGIELNVAVTPILIHSTIGTKITF